MNHTLYALVVRFASSLALSHYIDETKDSYRGLVLLYFDDENLMCTWTILEGEI